MVLDFAVDGLLWGLEFKSAVTANATNLVLTAVSWS